MKQRLRNTAIMFSIFINMSLRMLNRWNHTAYTFWEIFSTQHNVLEIYSNCVYEKFFTEKYSVVWLYPNLFNHSFNWRSSEFPVSRDLWVNPLYTFPYRFLREHKFSLLCNKLQEYNCWVIYVWFYKKLTNVF